MLSFTNLCCPGKFGCEAQQEAG